MNNNVYRFKKPQGAALMDRIICAISYLTGGLIGFIWIVIKFLTKKDNDTFTMYHVSQAVFFFLFLYILSLMAGFLYDIVKNIPYLGDFVTNILQFLLTPIYSGFSIIYGFIFILTLYMALGALLGRYSYIPFISDIINTNLGR